MSGWRVQMLPAVPSAPAVLFDDAAMQSMAWLLDSASKATILFGTACLLSFAMRKSAATQRHRLWVWTMLAGMSLPLMTWASHGPPIPPLGLRAFAYGGLLVWGFGSSLFLLSMLRGLRQLHQLTKAATPWVGSAQWWEQLCAQNPALSRRRRPHIAQSASLSTPLTWGFLRPVVLLPHDWERWTNAEQNSALSHEWAHIQRRDWLWQHITRLALAFYWFHPLAWWAHRRVILEAEKSCDNHVLSHGIRPSQYARMLLERSIAPGNPWLATYTTGMAQRSQLGQRIQAILEHGAGPQHRRKGLGLFCLACLSIVALSSASSSWLPARRGHTALPGKASSASTPTTPRRRVLVPHCEPSPALQQKSTQRRRSPLLYTPLRAPTSP